MKTSSNLSPGFTTAGVPMSPTFTHGARGQVYRYYVSASLQCGGRRLDYDAIQRVPANVIEKLVQQCVSTLDPRQRVSIADTVARVEVHPTTVQVVVRRAVFTGPGDAMSQTQTLASRLPIAHRLTGEGADPTLVRVTIPCRLKLRGGRIVVTDATGQVVDGQPPPDPTLIKALKTARRLLAEVGDAPIAAPDRAALQASPVGPYERGLPHLAFLAPDLQTQILEGRQPPGLTLQRIIASELPPAWDDQRRLFAGLN